MVQEKEGAARVEVTVDQGKEEIVVTIEVQNAGRNQEISGIHVGQARQVTIIQFRETADETGVLVEEGTGGKVMVEVVVGRPRTILIMDASLMVKEEKGVAVTGQEGDIEAEVIRRRIETVDGVFHGFSQ